MPALGHKRPDCGKENPRCARTLTATTGRVDSLGPVTGLSSAYGPTRSEMVDFNESSMEDNSTSRRRKRTAGIAQAYRMSHEIMSAAIGIAVLAGLGYWFDGKLGWTPVLTICGAGFGFVTAAFSLRRLLARLDRESAQRKQQRSHNTKAQDE